ncbi:hypothetical protein V6N13_083363 [Hibiscus sabdariffa]|uniref:NAC domain-containing protein n=1 Tax=Hibiscus sabdariffa TaxID=183260 RepID=A0ABR2SYC6_9ROSI
MTSDQYMVRIPPGFRFVPTDYELIKYYLSNKLKGQPLPCDKHIHEREIYGEKNKEPWNIFGETSSKTFYVFIELRKKGEERTIDRIAGSGTWKGQRTYLVMDSEKNHLDHWVLCRIYNKNGKDGPLELDEDDSEDDMLGTVPPSASIDSQHNGEFQLPTEGSSFGALHDTQGDSLFDARMESDGLNNGLFLNQLLTEGSSFEAIHDGQEDSVFDAVMGSDGINNGLSHRFTVSKTKPHGLVPAKDSVGITMMVEIWRMPHCQASYRQALLCSRNNSSKQCWGQWEMGFLALHINFQVPTAAINSIPNISAH